jgi:two-component system chemotaxis response regulator CheB
MVVDDAVVVRGIIARWIESEPGLDVAALLRSGREAIEQIERTSPDVILLDVDMADIDGITALPQLLAKKRDVVVIMVSTLTRRNAEVSLRALALGAADYVTKPQTTREFTSSAAFRRELLDKVRQLGARARGGAARLKVARQIGPPAGATGEPAKIALRPLPALVPRVLVVGSSTGGPQALNRLVAGIGPVIDQAPVLITQHMPPTFTTILAEHLTRACGRPVREAEHGEPVRAGQIYLARGGRHMRVARQDGAAAIALDDGPAINFCKPAVDPMFASAAEVWRGWVLGLILTGMGTDGTRGAAQIVATGGSVIAQDDKTSVVWGMPGSAARAGLCSAVLPLDQIAPKIVEVFSGGRS